MCLHCVSKVSDANRKALKQVEFPVHALSENTKSIMKKKIEKKMLSSKYSHFVINYFLSIKYLHANVQGVYIVYAKYQMPTAKALLQVEFPVYELSENTNS